MRKFDFKKALPYIASILFFAVLSYVYFLPDIMEGKVLFQHDTQQGIAVGQEGRVFEQETGETTWWTNSLFSGMPSFQISPRYSNNDVINVIGQAYHLWLPSPVSLLFIMMTGFFILLLALKVRWPLAVLGAIAYTFSSYFFILIEAGHLWKFITLAYIPPTIAGIILAYRGKYLQGCALTALFATLQITSNHMQMTYYFLFVILAIVITFFIDSYRKKQLGNFLKATGVLVIAGIIAIAANLPSLYNTYQYSKETMRGGHSELTSPDNNNQTVSNGGLEKEYITQWSYGIGETWSLLIPNVKGGASGALAQNKTARKAASPQMQPILNQVNSYWGNQPFTSGPVYVGAFIMMLFVLGCFIVKSSFKWALLAATILSVLLSWGHNFMLLSDLFIDYVPMYNKFRAVSSILVIAEFCIPVLAILTLKEIIENPGILKAQRKAFYMSLGITGGACLLFALFPSLFFSFLSNGESQMISQTPEYRDIFAQVETIREAVFRADAWRSLLVIALGTLGLWLYSAKKIKTTAFIILTGLIILGDMYMVNKRYLNSEDFVSKTKLSNPFPMSPADQMILQDKDPNYRVLNLSTNTFNDAATSYYHKSVGGYHAAKLRRYQDLIDRQLSKQNMAVINMLNTRYVIVPTEDRKSVTAMLNPDALGNAWLVSDIKWVDSPDAEMNALDNFNPRITAVIDKRFKELVKTPLAIPAAGDTIYETSYKPNALRYKVKTSQDAFAVFSEIYFPWGWNATIDGKEVKEARVNYVLRGLSIPAGEHEIVFRFDPKSLHITTNIAYAALVLLLILGIAAVLWPLKQNKKSSTDN
ncbi:YfhO family protein [Barnesiella propionica]|uniref:YfhO family protein n=1 Tax=Barnesiella propionica TaxID=2981781 RepID=UPI0011C70427|nr:YfhO family protein [Barnesiella propionica]MCU6768951.1 YfhO family protein [Barnesiella propionica]